MAASERELVDLEEGGGVSAGFRPLDQLWAASAIDDAKAPEAPIVTGLEPQDRAESAPEVLGKPQHWAAPRAEELPRRALSEGPGLQATFGQASETSHASALASQGVTERLAPLPPLRRALSVVVTLTRNMAESRLEPTARCSICLEQVALSECGPLELCGREAHSTCQACMSTYLKLRINEARVDNLTCPLAGDDGCTAAATPGELERLLDTETLEKYRRFVKIKECSRLRSCPHCGELCDPGWRIPGDESSGVCPEITCGTCSQEFCYYHSNAHAPGPEACAAYEREIVKREAVAFASMGVKRCPNCGVMTDKTSGCNHMSCVSCRADWCWSCGKILTNVGWHYNPLKPGSCQQFIESRPQREHVRALTLHYLIYIIGLPAGFITVIFVTLMFLSLLFLCLSTCCPGLLFCASCGCRGVPFEKSSQYWGHGNILLVILGVGVPFICFSVAWAVLAIPIWLLLLLPLGATGDDFSSLAGVPMVTAVALVESFGAD